MHRTVAALLAPLGLLLASNAQAQCAEPYTLDNLLADLGTIEGALRSGDNATAGGGADKMEAGFACMNEVLPVMIVGRAYRAVGAGKIAAGNTDRGLEWFRTATEVEQSFDYGLEDLPADHPVRMYYSDAKIQASGEVVVMEDMSFIDGNHWVDGREVDVPKGRLDRPHLYQLEGGGNVLSWVITGNGFPPDVLQAGAATDAVADAGTDEPTVVGKPPKQKKDKPEKDKPEKVAKDQPEKEKKGKELKPTASTGSDGTVVIKRQRPWEKTPLLIGGGAIIAGAGGLYLAATGSRNAFDNAESLDEIERLQTTTNQLVIISAATLAVGAGTFTWGVILDGGTPVPSVQIRF